MLIGFNEDLSNVAHYNAPTIPLYLYFLNQLTFAAITPALITGGMAERLNFKTWLIFAPLWVTLVYCPITHMFWHPEGWLKKLGTLDYSGGSVVHITCGTAALVFSIFMQKRKDTRTLFTWIYDKLWKKTDEVIIHWGEIKKPVINHSIPQMLLGTAILWFGWFGFNGGGSFTSGVAAPIGFINTILASCSGGITWMFIEWCVSGNPRISTTCEGIIAGLIAITPSAGLVNPGYAVAIGIINSIITPIVVLIKSYLIDDSLDAVGLHLTGGIVGSLLTGIFSSKLIAFNGSGTVIKGGWVDGNWIQVPIQMAGIGTAFAWTFVVTTILYWILRPFGWNVSKYEERIGLDTSQHAEQSYVYEPPEKTDLMEGETKPFSIRGFIKNTIFKMGAKEEKKETQLPEINVNE